jgi:hypothetical protein
MKSPKLFFRGSDPREVAREAPRLSSRFAQSFAPSFAGPIAGVDLRIASATVAVWDCPEARAEFPTLLVALALRIGTVETENGPRLARAEELSHGTRAEIAARVAREQLADPSAVPAVAPLSRRELKRRAKSIANNPQANGGAVSEVPRAERRNGRPDVILYRVSGLEGNLLALRCAPWCADVNLLPVAPGTGRLIDGKDSDGTATARPEPPRPRKPADVRKKEQTQRRARVASEVESRPMTVSGVRVPVDGEMRTATTTATETFEPGTARPRKQRPRKPNERAPVVDNQARVMRAMENATERPELVQPVAVHHYRGDGSAVSQLAPPVAPSAVAPLDNPGTGRTVAPVDSEPLPFAPGACSAYPRRA